MKYDVLSAMRNATLQTSSGSLMDATRAIQEKLQAGLPGLQESFTPASAYKPVFHGGSEKVVGRQGNATDYVIDGDFVHVDGQGDKWQASTATRSDPATNGDFTSAEFQHAGLSINYRLFLPPAAVRNGALLVMLHGCTQDATDFSTGTAMNTLALETGYTVLYPSQSMAANPNGCWNWFQPAHQQRTAGEPAIISALTRSVCQRHTLDSSRVFVAGLSAGGAMALILAEEFPEIYTAVGVHSGLATGLANSVPQALRAMTGGATPAPVKPATRYRPTLVIHGDQDNTVSPQNASYIVNRCQAQYAQTHPGEKLVLRSHDESVKGQSVKRHEYRSANGVLVCRHWQLGGLGHAWSGGDARGSHTVSGGMNASQSLLDFFDQCASLPG